MDITRRTAIATAAAALLPTVRMRAAKQKLAGLKIGVTDWNLDLTGKLDAVALSKTLGFEGVQVSIGRKLENEKLPLADPQLQEQYLAEAKKNNIPIAGTCLDILHVNYLKNDALGKKWVAEGIPITRKLNAKVMLLPFFGKGALQTTAEKDYVADVVKELAPEAQKAGVVLGLENTISAEDNARILDRVKSRAVSVYYDVGNSTSNGFDVVKEIRWLGKDRICQVHLKDKGYLGEGKIDFPAVMRALADIGYVGFAVFETSAPSGSRDNDMRKNLAYIQKVIGEVRQS
jgi:L-ribulose-5-phosphate 3-epimerase